ncbi:ATP-binding cassette domain-containing protein [Geoglobus acetivorans]|uniref:ATP-binding cassette domain-containing protein n=1 Tax=Geoglobus acetivorans TaxID=565033 RepID=A0ABZ3H244_GEOAI|nr:ATP-binding cassette domain-containing protein [Geoglobus acetivorans]
MKPLLKVENVKKKFGELVALENISFEVFDRECLGIIGPNGAGKTTLFNVISGHMRPTEGRVFFDGKDITGKRPSELVKLGLVRTFQIIRAFRNMTVEENFQAVGGDYEGIMKELGLWGKRNMVAKNLSQGDLRKLNIGLSLTTKPKLLLLDEPFSGLSPKECAELHAVIDHLKERGVTMVIIEHKLKELFSHVERVLVLNYGILLCEGKPDEVVNDVKVIEAYLGDGYAVA